MLPMDRAAGGTHEEKTPGGETAGPDAARKNVGGLAPRGSVKGKDLWTSWHTGDAYFFPKDQALFDDALERLLSEYVFPGHLPSAPMLDADDLVIALGSCFARELRTFLAEAGVASSRVRVPEGLNNTFAILDFFSWVVRGVETGEGFRYGRLESGAIRDWVPEHERLSFLASFESAGAFVLTVGLAEVWRDRETGGVFWRGIPQELFDDQRHVFEVTTVDQNAANLLQTIDLIREVNPDAPVVLTLSPVPLEATFRDMSCITADCVSKSVLRVAVDQVMRQQRDGVYYWPSFEIVRWVGAHLPWLAYGLEDGKPRHVTRRLVGLIIDAFVDAFYVPGAQERIRGR